MAPRTLELDDIQGTVAAASAAELSRGLSVVSGGPGRRREGVVAPGAAPRDQCCRMERAAAIHPEHRVHLARVARARRAGRGAGSIPAEFRGGMASRKAILGDTGASDPAAWVTPLGTDQVHIGVIISSSSAEALREPLAVARAMPGLTCMYELAVGVPPTGREHFGFRDGIGGPLVIGSGASGFPGQDAIMPGEFIFGYPDESGATSNVRPGSPDPQWQLLAFRQMHADVASFRRYLRANARSAKTRSCWRRR